MVSHALPFHPLRGVSQPIWPGRPPGRRQITMPRRRPPFVDARRCCLVALRGEGVFVRAVRAVPPYGACGPVRAVRARAGRPAHLPRQVASGHARSLHAPGACHHRQASARLLSRIGTSSRCPARSGARWWSRIIVVAACVLTVVAVAACTGAPRPGTPLAPPSRGRPARPARPRRLAPSGPRWPVTRTGASRTPVTCTSSKVSLTGPTCRRAPRSGCSCPPPHPASWSARSGWAGTAATCPACVWTSPTTPGTLPARGEDRPAGIDGGRALVAEPAPCRTAGWPPGSRCRLRLDASTGVQSDVCPECVDPLSLRGGPGGAGFGGDVLPGLQRLGPATAYRRGHPAQPYPKRELRRTAARRVTFDRPLLRTATGPEPTSSSSCRWSPYAERLGLPLAYLTSVDLDLDPGVLHGAPRHDQRGARRVLVTGHAGRRHAGP